MSYGRITTKTLDNIADAIRAKTGNPVQMTPLQMVNEINSIQIGEANVQSDWEQLDNTADDYIKNKPIIPDELADLADDEMHRLVTDNQITGWNDKLDSGAISAITNQELEQMLT